MNNKDEDVRLYFPIDPTEETLPQFCMPMPMVDILGSSLLQCRQTDGLFIAFLAIDRKEAKIWIVNGTNRNLRLAIEVRHGPCRMIVNPSKTTFYVFETTLVGKSKTLRPGKLFSWPAAVFLEPSQLALVSAGLAQLTVNATVDGEEGEIVPTPLIIQDDGIARIVIKRF